MKNRLVRLFLWAGVCALPYLVQAQSSHYVVGTEGIKAGSLPPPGVYLRDYNSFYFADRFPGGPPGFDVFAYANVPRLIWISEFKILGAYYGADFLVPFVYQDVKAGGAKDDNFGVGDLCIEPITLSWHGKQYDIAVGYAFFAPSGDYSPTEMASPGRGFWTHMFTAGGTWYPDEKKTWAVSALNRYEINSENSDLDITPGNTWTVEWGVSKSLKQTIEVGAVGYYQLQTTTDSGAFATDATDQIIGIGPEISVLCPKLGVFTSARYVYEFGARNRPEGHTVTVTFTKRF